MPALHPGLKRTAKAVAAFADENIRHGTENISGWKQTESGLRHACRKLIRAESADDIALIKNTSEGLSMVGIRKFPGKKHEKYRICTTGNFPFQPGFSGNRFRCALELRQDASIYIRPLRLRMRCFRQVDKKIRGLIAVSAVQYDHGALRMGPCWNQRILPDPGDLALHRCHTDAGVDTL